MAEEQGSSPLLPPTPNYISLEELNRHNHRNDLWIAVHGKVYDVTNWLNTHPGGSLPLLNLAGQDVTDAFLAFHPKTVHHRLEAFFTGSYLDQHRVPEVSGDYRTMHSKLEGMGLFEQKRSGVYAALLLIAAMFCVCVYGVVCCGSGLVHLGCGGLMGFLWIQSGWIGHDAAHSQIFQSKSLNMFFLIMSGNVFAGISIGWWKWNHNAHHIACNSLDFDPDLQHLPFFVVSSKLFSSISSRFYGRKMEFDAFARFLVSYQQLTFYPVMCFARIYLFAQSFMLLFSNRKVPNRMMEIFGLVVFWIWFSLLVSYLPNWGERIAFVVVSFSVTGIQHVQFCLNHFSGKVYVGPPNASDWIVKQANGTLDVECSSWMDWFHGGLQFQVEHHMFPRLPRCNLRRIAPLVKDYCRKHDLPYNCVSFWKANVLTVRTLRDAALQAQDLSKPVPKNLVWEAVNTHG